MLNIYGLIILIFLLFKYILEIVSRILHIKTIKNKIPKEFKDFYNQKRYKKSQRYTKERVKFSILILSFNLLILLLFWFLGGFAKLNVLIESWQLSFLIKGLLYIGFIYFLLIVLNLPFNFYSTFVIEEKYGFNKTSPKTFALDFIKNLFLSILLSGGVLVIILLMFKYWGQIAWIYVWVSVSLFEIVVMFLSPKFIMPLFNKFKPLQNTKLKKAIFKYAKKINYPLKQIFIMDGSKRSTKSNAFFMGFGKNKKIALYDTLLDKHSISEIIAILGHEIGHYKKKHIFVHLIINILSLGLMFYLFSIFLTKTSFFNAFFVSQPNIYIGIVIFSLLYAPINYIISIITNILFRKFEYQADDFSKKTANYKDMIKALKKLAVNNLSNLYPHPFYVFLNYSHPPVLKRIKNLKNID